LLDLERQRQTRPVVIRNQETHPIRESPDGEDAVGGVSDEHATEVVLLEMAREQANRESAQMLSKTCSH
jgi:hypothetical protein